MHRAELLSIPVTLLVLLFAFGALTAAVVPVVLALSAVAAGLGLLADRSGAGDASSDGSGAVRRGIRLAATRGRVASSETFDRKE
jgi:putative drug exporter of the RND superfamily